MDATAATPSLSHASLNLVSDWLSTMRYAATVIGCGLALFSPSAGRSPGHTLTTDHRVPDVVTFAVVANLASVAIVMSRVEVQQHRSTSSFVITRSRSAVRWPSLLFGIALVVLIFDGESSLKSETLVHRRREFGGGVVVVVVEASSCAIE
ncbi:unnamed protein product [Soboliphyme baturini]|uniref:DUF202 domain-containing protein n=1 Tax=Soboliphyme baturini TaxID=241478 RepID=A0A183IP26_9BILA|nr:unnamed protein product [Soboliphyme baturini]